MSPRGAFGNGTTVLLGALMLGAAGGDALLPGMIRGVPGDAWVRAHPSKMGSLVLSHPSSEAPRRWSSTLPKGIPATKGILANVKTRWALFFLSFLRRFPVSFNRGPQSPSGFGLNSVCGAGPPRAGIVPNSTRKLDGGSASRTSRTYGGLPI